MRNCEELRIAVGRLPNLSTMPTGTSPQDFQYGGTHRLVSGLTTRTDVDPQLEGYVTRHFITVLEGSIAGIFHCVHVYKDLLAQQCIMLFCRHIILPTTQVSREILSWHYG